MGAIATYRGLLSNRPLVRLLAGEFVSGIGDWLYLVALLVIVYRESDGDPVLLGIIGGARIIPYIVLSVPAGMVADRFDRKMILLFTDIVRGAIMVVLAVLVMADGPLLAIVGLAIFATCFSSFFQPAIGAYMPMLARNERELGPANSAFATLGEIAFILGPAVSGIIIATADLEWAFIINAVTFGFVALMLLGLPSGRPGETPGADLARRQAEAGEPVAPPVADPTGDLASTGEAESAATTTASPVAANEPAARKERPEKVPLMTALRPVMRPFAGLVALDLVAGFMFGGISVLTVILAVGRLGEPESATGFLNAAIGVGGVIGAVGSSAIVLRANLAPPLFVGAAVLGVGFLILAAATFLSLSLVAMAVIAAGALLAGVVGQTVFQRVIPDSIRGRALGIWMTLSTLMYAAGAFLTPIIVTEIGFWTLAVGGFAIIAAGVVAVVLVGPDLRRAPDASIDTLRRVSRLPLFAGVPPAALEATANRLIQVPVTAGEVVIRQGEPADRFFIIESGQFAVDQHDAATGETRRLRVMGPDDVFGELGLMHHAPRSATITAETDGHLLALEGANFLELLNVGPSLSGRLLERYGGASVAPPT
jgi:MFS family permease